MSQGLVAGTVLVRGARVPAVRFPDQPHVFRDRWDPYRQTYKLAECGKKVASTWQADG